MKLGIIGFGNMAEAILGGILSSGFITKDEVMASGKDEIMLKKASEKYGIQTENDNKVVVAEADVILLSVKPQILPEVIDEIKDICSQEKLIISIVTALGLRGCMWGVSCCSERALLNVSVNGLLIAAASLIVAPKLSVCGLSSCGTQA